MELLLVGLAVGLSGFAKCVGLTLAGPMALAGSNVSTALRTELVYTSDTPGSLNASVR